MDTNFIQNLRLVPAVYATNHSQRIQRIRSCLDNCNPSDGVCINRCNTLNDTTVTIGRPAQVDPKFSEIGGVITTVINAGIIFAAIIAFIFLVWGGIQWITSGGDKQGLEDARNRITNAIVGLVIVAAAWAIFNLVQTILVGDILQLQQTPP